MNNEHFDKIVSGSVVVVKNNRQVESELQQDRRYLVLAVDKVGKDYQDWYLHLLGVDRTDSTGFCINRFALEEDEQVAAAYRQGVNEIMALKKSMAFFVNHAHWLAYKEAVQQLVPCLRLNDPAKP